MSEQDNKPTAAAATGSIPIPKSSRGVKGFFSDVRRELKKVTWPTVPETNRLTGVVLAVCLMLMIILGVMGTTFDTVIHLLTSSSKRA